MLDVIVTSLVQPEVSIPSKLARLYLLSDILHNSGLPIPNAWRFRSGYAVLTPDPKTSSFIAHMLGGSGPSAGQAGNEDAVRHGALEPRPESNPEPPQSGAVQGTFPAALCPRSRICTCARATLERVGAP